MRPCSLADIVYFITRSIAINCHLQGDGHDNWYTHHTRAVPKAGIPDSQTSRDSARRPTANHSKKATSMSVTDVKGLFTSPTLFLTLILCQLELGKGRIILLFDFYFSNFSSVIPGHHPEYPGITWGKWILGILTWFYVVFYLSETGSWVVVIDCVSWRSSVISWWSAWNTLHRTLMWSRGY